MIANYHTHTHRCHHAVGTDEEYIKKAIAEGVKILGFSDHAPYIYPNGYVSYYKMTPDESHEYFTSLRALREKYRDYIEIRIGYEAEYYAKLWNETLKFWESTNPPEYLMLGQHFSPEEYPIETRLHAFKPSDEASTLSVYVDSVLCAINTGKFSCVAHPDVIYPSYDLDFYKCEMEKIVLAAKAKNLPLEINLLGLSEGRHYPNPTFWKLAARHSPKVILGCDAHSPERVADKSEIAQALRFADKYKLELIDEITLIDPFKY